jgi:hypothetical protein
MNSRPNSKLPYLAPVAANSLTSNWAILNFGIAGYMDFGS